MAASAADRAAYTAQQAAEDAKRGYEMVRMLTHVLTHALHSRPA
jgi:hypothetical protein